jgi:putative sterol carrier protein
MTDAQAAMAAIADADASELSAMVGKLSDKDLAEGLADPGNRERVLNEIFQRMADHVDPTAIKDVDAVIHFKITDAPDGGDDTFEAVFKDGAVTVNHEPTSDDPKVTIIAGPVAFLKLVTGNDSPPMMFLKGKLKVKGDLMFAGQMASFFAIPDGS